MSDTTTYVRLLVCTFCKSLEALPDFQGQGQDVTLELLGERHVSPGHNEYSLSVGRVEESKYNNTDLRKGIEDEIRKTLAGGTTGFEAAYYQTKETFKDDAFTCWVRDHGRRPSCEDYKSEKKLLKPGTKADRKSVGLPEARTKVYLCDFCPVKSNVQQAHFKKLGLYN